MVLNIAFKSESLEASAALEGSVFCVQALVIFKLIEHLVSLVTQQYITGKRSSRVFGFVRMNRALVIVQRTAMVESLTAVWTYQITSITVAQHVAFKRTEAVVCLATQWSFARIHTSFTMGHDVLLKGLYT